ncbi:MAG: FRG domain-containing protein [Rhodocyclaceae bacterium]|nr:FRG domain-containing protein [Rhodocyclaceae bacterium]
MNPTIIQVGSIKEYLDKSFNLRRQQWAFRGHSDSTWKIQSTASRYFFHHQVNIRRKWIPSRELEAIRRFQRTAHHFLQHLPEESDYFSWLSVMRHYGAPTRLIDFTYSPISALFFAYSDAYRSFKNKACIHAVHIESVVKKTCSVMNKERIDELESGDFFSGQNGCALPDCVGLFDGRWNTPRQSAQQGLFMVTSGIDTNVHEFLQKCPTPDDRGLTAPWLIFQFPGTQKIHKEAVEYLLSASQTHEALYPGIEGLSQSLAMKFYEPLSPIRRIR